jgi:glycine/D-amino acid oxidase-like deaminating enzyme/nitrite reductase/ring-hydroxylating ferredoxin subunit
MPPESAVPDPNPPIASLWTETGGIGRHPGLHPAGPPDADRTVDVAVVGGGIAGLSIALRLKEAGAEVVVLERHRVGTGVTGGSTAKVTALHGLIHVVLRRLHGAEATARYAAANAAAVGQMAALVDRHGVDCDFTRAEALNIATTPQGLARLTEDLEAARDAGLPVADRDETELPFPVLGAVALPDQAHVHPRRYCEGLAAALGSGAVHEGTAVTSVDEDGSDGHGQGGDGARCHVHTAAGPVVHAAHAVIATQGPIVDPRYVAVRCRPVRSYVVAVEVAGPVPQGMYLSVEEPVRSLRPATVDGTRYLLVGGEGHPVGDERDARTNLSALEAWAREHFDVTAVRHRWAAHDQVPSDHLPFVGRLTPGGHRWVATGFQKWGFTTSTVAANIVADGIAAEGGAAEGSTSEPDPLARLLDPTRLRSTATVDLAWDVSRVARRYVGDEVAVRLGRRGGRDGAHRLGDLPPGDGTVIHTGDGPTAVHRDDDGHLHAVSATCTHEGCLVRFNRAQCSWDCPCHGSRFAPDGTVLSGPAAEDLRRVDLPEASTAQSDA